MKVTQCELVELDDATTWLRVGTRMTLVDTEALGLTAPQVVTVKPTLAKAGDPFLDGLDAKCRQPKGNGKQRQAQEVTGDEGKFRELLRAGAPVVKAARESGVVLNRAYYLAAKWKKEPDLPVVEAAPAPSRRCQECKQRTATDPCQHCGSHVAGKGGA